MPPTTLVHAPAGTLAPLVQSLWFSERAALVHRRERSLPTGCVDIVIPLLERQTILRHADESAPEARAWRTRGPVVQGAQDRYLVRGVEGPSRVAGVQFKPGGAAAWFGALLPELRNRTVGLDDLWGPAARELQEQLAAIADPSKLLRHLERALRQRLRDAAVIDPAIDLALAAFDRAPADARIEPVRLRTGLLPAAFIRRFEAAVGLTPKRYTRVRRLHALLPALASGGAAPDWAQTALEGGYADQAHLVHEFRRITGLTPSAYRPVHPAQPTHVALR